MRFFILIILNSIIISFAFSQEKKFIRQGNNSYEDSDFEESELKYRKALEKRSTSFDAAFNLGDALFKQEKFEEASKQFENLSVSENNKEDIAKAYHNLGNSLLQTKDEQGQPKLEEAVEAYKNALRNNPKDNETRFNLAQAQKLLKQQQEQQKQNKDNKDQNKDDKKDKKDQDKKDDKKDENKDKKDKEDEQKDKQDEKNKDQKDQKKEDQKQQQIPKEKAEQMLKALENDEKDLQKKMKMQKAKGKKVNVEKDW